MPEGAELSLGAALGSGSWVVPVADLDKTFVGAPMSFVGAMTAKVTLNSPTGKPLDKRNIRFEWSKPEFYSVPPAGQTEPAWGSTPLRLPGELSPRRPQDRLHPHPYRTPLNPLPRPCEPTPHRPQLPTARPRPTRCEDSRRKRGRNGPTAPAARDAGTLAGNLSFRRKCQLRLKRSRRRFLTQRSILRRRQAPLRPNRRPA
jgi:hypothetical protein